MENKLKLVAIGIKLKGEKKFTIHTEKATCIRLISRNKKKREIHYTF